MGTPNFSSRKNSQIKRIHLSPLFINTDSGTCNLRFREPSKSRDNSRSLRKSLSFHSLSIRDNIDNSDLQESLSLPRLNYDDRFIPRPIRDVANAQDALSGHQDEAKRFTQEQTQNLVEDAEEKYENMLNCVSDSNKEDRILTFTKPLPKDGLSKAVEFIRTAVSKPKWRLKRHVPKVPERVLDAPELLNDFCNLIFVIDLNILDWGGDNCIAVGLGPSIYIWSANTGSVSKLDPFNEEDNSSYVSAVQWSGSSSGSCLSVGLSSGETKLYDVRTLKCLRTLKDGSSRIPSISWNENILSCGTRRGAILNFDVRIQQAHISTLEVHSQEVCGLAWSSNGQYLASGGNDNDVYVWDKTGVVSSGPQLRNFHAHCAAVKAVSWHPSEPNVLATGGGTSDHCLNFWNVFNGNHLSSVPTNSQITGIVWNPRSSEFVTSHGHPQNQLTLWSYPAMEMAAHLISFKKFYSGHSNRVLGITLSTDGTLIASVAADETLRLWKCFDPPQKRTRNHSQELLGDKSRYNVN